MISMAGRTVAEIISTTAATQEARIGAALETSSEAISEATTEATIGAATEAPFELAVAADGMITTAAMTGAETRIGVNRRDIGKVVPEAQLTRDMGGVSALGTTVLPKGHLSSACQTRRGRRIEHLRLGKMSLGVTFGLLRRKKTPLHLHLCQHRL